MIDKKNGEEEREEQDWRELCERASRETDPEVLLALVEQINQALERREQRIQQARANKTDRSH